jgi:hypothetical protein
MARIKLVPIERLDPALREMAEQAVGHRQNPAIFRAMGNLPGAFKAYWDFYAPLRLVKRNNPESSFRLPLDSRLCRAIFGPSNPYKASLFRDNLLELFITVGIVGVLILECFCSLKKRLLNFFQQHGKPSFQSFYSYPFAGTLIAPYQHNAVVLYIAWPDFQTHRHSSQFPFIKFPARRVLAQINFDAHFAEGGLDFDQAAFFHSAFGRVNSQAERGGFGEDDCGQALLVLGAGDDAEERSGTILLHLNRRREHIHGLLFHDDLRREDVSSADSCVLTWRR